MAYVGSLSSWTPPQDRQRPLLSSPLAPGASGRSARVAAFSRPKVGLLASLFLRGYSSAGRALAWHARGQGFESPYLHKEIALFHMDFRTYFRHPITAATVV